jgi:hypothetical protein
MMKTLSAWYRKKIGRTISNYLNRHGMIASVETLGENGPDDSHYVGDIANALYLAKRDILPELSHPDNNVCSIGWCEREEKWYGWSHRAIYGFGIGSMIKEGDCGAESGWIDEYLKEHPEEDRSLPVGFKAKTVYDARRMAIAFADSVS